MPKRDNVDGNSSGPSSCWNSCGGYHNFMIISKFLVVCRNCIRWSVIPDFPSDCSSQIAMRVSSWQFRAEAAKPLVLLLKHPSSLGGPCRAPETLSRRVDMIISSLNASYPGCATGEHGFIKASHKTCSMIELLILECVAPIAMSLTAVLFGFCSATQGRRF